jgi:hypothetical protein
MSYVNILENTYSVNRECIQELVVKEQQEFYYKFYIHHLGTYFNG